MILQRLARSKSAWKPLSECTNYTRSFHSSISRQHSVPDLTYGPHFEQNGVEGLLGPEGYDTAWSQNMTHLINRLNRSTAGQESENMSTKNLVLQYARDPKLATVFNAASLAHNTHFFFSALSPAPTPLENYKALQDSLVDKFGSIDALRRTMLTTANVMYAPGFVWLAAVRSRAAGDSRMSWRILTTYNAGTPYTQAHRQQTVDMNTQPSNNVGSFGEHSGRSRDPAPPGGPDLLEPVLCVSTWEHIYLKDYGVGGKQQYLLNWWKSINWGAVDQKTPEELKRSLGNFKSSFVS